MNGRRYLTANEAPNFNIYDRRKLQVIWSRIELLEKQIVERQKINQNCSRDIQEVSALRWVLEFAGAPIPPKPEDKEPDAA